MTPLETIKEARDTYQVTGGTWALFSGGNDSLVSLRLAMDDPEFRGAIHINTNTGTKAGREFVYDTCKDLRCPLIEYCAKENTNAKGQADPMDYEQMVLDHGFPGANEMGHRIMYAKLKERALRRFRRERSPNEKYIFATGCRSSESTRRMGNTSRIQVDSGHRVWVNHIHDWTKEDVSTFKAESKLPNNPVAELMCRSMECNCGAFEEEEGTLETMTQYDVTRELAYWLLDLQARVIANGFPWKWHESPPKWFIQSRRGQEFMFEMSKYPEIGVMCQKCEEHNSMVKVP